MFGACVEIGGDVILEKSTSPQTKKSARDSPRSVIPGIWDNQNILCEWCSRSAYGFLLRCLNGKLNTPVNLDSIEKTIHAQTERQDILTEARNSTGSCQLRAMEEEDQVNENAPLCHGCEDHWSWNRRDRSHEVRLYGPGLRVAHFHPNWSSGTAGVRGTRALDAGRYYWELRVSRRIFGTSMMFGVATRRARLHSDTFTNLLGEDDQGWGLSHKGLLWHGGKWSQFTKPFTENKPTTIGILYDGVAGTLTYYKDGENLGVAFRGLHRCTEPLYPYVCSTAAKTEMILNVQRRDFVNLQDRCRDVIIKRVKTAELLRDLRLPPRISDYLAEALIEDQQRFFQPLSMHSVPVL